MSLSDSQTFRIQMDNTNFTDLENEIFNDHLKSPFNGEKLTSPKDPFDMEWNFESNLTSPKSFEDLSPKSPLSDYDSYFLDDKAGTSPFQSPISSEESSFNSPFESFLDSELEFSDLKMFEGNSNSQPPMIPKIEGMENQKMTAQHLNHHQPNMPINMNKNNNIFLNTNNMNTPNNNHLFNNNNNNNNKTFVNTNNNNTNNNLFINPQQSPIINIPIIQNPPINLKKPPTTNTTKSSTNVKANSEKAEPTNKKRKRVLNPNPLINPNTNAETKDNTTTPNSKYKYLLTEEKVMTTTSEEIDMYIEHLTKNNLISNEELKELKKQRRRIKNREYAKNKRDVNKGKVGDLHSRIEELENENKLLKEHLRNVLHQFEIFKQQVSLTNSGNNKITFNPPNLPTHPGQKPRPFNNNKSNTLFVFVILFSLGIYFNIFAGLGPVFSSSNKTGTSRMMLFFSENYYPFVEWIKSFFVRSSRSTLSYHPYYDWERPAKQLRQNSITDASYVERNETHIISYLAVQDKSRCFYENKYNWIQKEQQKNQR